MLNLMPLQNFNPMFRHLDEMEKELFGEFNESFSSFRTDIKEEDHQYVLTADLPGFKKEDINLEIKNNILEIQAQHEETNEVKEDNYIRRERKSGSFRRRFNIADIDINGIEASYNDGILELLLPKLSIHTPEVQKIEVK